MEMDQKLSAMSSKLSIYRAGLQNAKKNGDIESARVWLEHIANLKREIAAMK